MSTSPPLPDIAIKVGYEDGEYITNVRFNKLQKTLRLFGGQTTTTLLEVLTKTVNGTNAFVPPGPGKAEADLIDYQPVDILVSNMQGCPVEEDELEVIRDAMIAIEAEWFDIANPGVAG